jgi:hypothetical protein
LDQEKIWPHSSHPPVQTTCELHSLMGPRKLTLIQVAAGRSLDFIAVFKPSRRADSSGEAVAASRILEVLSCLIDDEPEAMVLRIANILGNMSIVKVLFR